MKHPLSRRDFYGDDHYLAMKRDYEEIRQRAHARKGKPDEYDRLLIRLDKAFESFYKHMLNDDYCIERAT